MKCKNKLQEDIITYLLQDERFHYIGYTGTHWFATYRKDDEYKGSFIDLNENKLQSGKGLAKVRFAIFSEDDTEFVNFKIEMELNSYASWDTFFKGWVENIEEFETVLKCVGLK